jgi:hypothetical protein
MRAPNRILLRSIAAAKAPRMLRSMIAQKPQQDHQSQQ